MKVSLKKAFSILDGRMSTNIDDIYEMLGFIFSQDLYTHQLPTSFDKLKAANPGWFANAKKLLDDIKSVAGTNDFKELMAIIDEYYPDTTITLEKLDDSVSFTAGLEKFLAKEELAS